MDLYWFMLGYRNIMFLWGSFIKYFLLWWLFIFFVWIFRFFHVCFSFFFIVFYNYFCFFSLLFVFFIFIFLTRLGWLLYGSFSFLFDAFCKLKLRDLITLAFLKYLDLWFEVKVRIGVHSLNTKNISIFPNNLCI